ncbi:MAG: hypothetical protein AAFQ09_07900 [Pseudomonadota bacterium]
MSYLGLLCLGLFVGGVIGLATSESSMWEKSTGGISAVLGAALGGALGVFLQYIPADQGLGDAVFAYPIGLVLGFIWPFGRGSWGIIKKKEPGNKFLAGLHISALVGVSALTFYLVMVPNGRAWLNQPLSL